MKKNLVRRLVLVFLLLLTCFSVWASPFSNIIYVERSVKGISAFAERKWKFTDSTFIVRDPKRKVQTEYPYNYDANYIYLGDPIHVDRRIGTYSSRRIQYVQGNHTMDLYFQNGEVLKLVDQDFKNDIVNVATAGAVGAAAVGGIGHAIAMDAAAKATMEMTQGLGLAANSAYSKNGMTFKTDDLGRVVEASGPVAPGRGMRNSNNTKHVGKMGRSGDDGGHLIADSLGGTSDFCNLVPMDGHLNKGAYNSLEKQLLKASRSGSDVRVQITPEYSGSDFRPTAFIYKYWIDGVSYVKKFFN